MRVDLARSPAIAGRPLVHWTASVLWLLRRGAWRETYVQVLLRLLVRLHPTSLLQVRPCTGRTRSDDLEGQSRLVRRNEHNNQTTNIP